MGVYHHTDPGAPTVLLQDDKVTSLQVLHRGAQKWVFVPPRKGTYVINIGQLQLEVTA
jgi:isopenicillin N synthase-like dioxygenase